MHILLPGTTECYRSTRAEIIWPYPNATDGDHFLARLGPARARVRVRVGTRVRVSVHLGELLPVDQQRAGADGVEGGGGSLGPILLDDLVLVRVRARVRVRVRVGVRARVRVRVGVRVRVRGSPPYLPDPTEGVMTR